jgi:hypothetical protein
MEYHLIKRARNGEIHVSSQPYGTTSTPVIVARHDTLTIHREYANDSDTQIQSTEFMKTSVEENLSRGKESVTLGRRRTSPLRASISDKVVGIHGTSTQIRLQVQLPS